MNLFLLLILISTSVFAQMEDADTVKNKTNASITEAISNIRYKCKCSVSFDVHWSGFTNPIHMKKAQYIAINFGRAMPSYCADDGAEIACSIKKVSISYGTRASARFTDGHAEIITDGVNFDGFDQIIAIKEKAESEKEKASKPAPNP